MSVRLDICVAAGPARVAALVRETLSSHRIGGVATFHGAKRPVAILIAQGDVCRAFDMAGRDLAPAKVEALCPGAWAEFMAAEKA